MKISAINRYFIILSVICFNGCTQKKEISGFDSLKWKRDIGGCLQDRSEMMEEIPDLTMQLKGMSEDQIVETLGNPERNHLYKRNQQFYEYDIDPAEGCEKYKESGRYLQIRFSATSMAKEVMIYER